MRPELKILEHVSRVSDRDCFWLLKQAVDESPAKLLEMRDNLLMQFWRAGDGLVLTQTLVDENDLELFVYGLAGRGILARLAEVAADLQVIAREYNCCRIGGNAHNPTLGKLYENLGARPVFTYYQMEVGCE